MSFAPKELQEEREAQAAAQKAAVIASLKRSGAGCLFIAILALCALFYLAGYVRAVAIKPDCVTPSRASTP
jgi:hypothetical protein